MTYKIVCFYGFFARDLVKGGCLSKYAVMKLMPDYFDSLIVMESGNKWEAVAKFAESFHDSIVNTNAYDFQESTDCVGVVVYALHEYDANGILTDIIFESDFPTIRL